MKWTNGIKNAKDVKDIAKHSDLILSGVVLSIDPASNSLGWAIYENGSLTKKGTIKAKKGAVNTRLCEIAVELEKIAPGVDLLAVEKIRGSRAHDYLKWAIGMVITTVKAKEFVEVPIQFWKKLVEDGYVKTDENDAELIGKVVITIAKDHHGQK